MAIYLDYNATCPIDPRVSEVMHSFYGKTFGNPSSLHRWGRVARVAIEEARGHVANLLGAERQNILFVSSGTEAINTAIKGIAESQALRGKHIITTSIEHHAALDTCHYLEECGWDVTYVPVESNGIVKPADVESACRDETILISIMQVNNEIGTIQPIAEVASIARNRDILVHVDAVQAVGKIPVQVDEIGIDLLSLSAHKIYGPKGVGALYVRDGLEFSPLIHGGSHEKNRRGGTENVAGIVGFGKAAELARTELLIHSERLAALRDRLEKDLLETIREAFVNGSHEQRVPNTTNICFPGAEGNSLAINLDLEEVGVSTGAACSTGSAQGSHVLLAIGLDEQESGSSIRFSLGLGTTEEEVDRVVQLMPELVERVRSARSEKDKVASTPGVREGGSR